MTVTITSADCERLRSFWDAANNAQVLRGSVTISQNLSELGFDPEQPEPVDEPIIVVAK